MKALVPYREENDYIDYYKDICFLNAKQPVSPLIIRITRLFLKKFRHVFLQSIRSYATFFSISRAF